MAKRRNDGDGSVYQMHADDCPRPVNTRGRSTCKCTWRGALIVGHKPTGRKKPDGTPILAPIRRTRTAATENGCAEKLRQLRAEIEASTLPLGGKSPTLEQWLNHCWTTILPRQKKPLRPMTLRAYRAQFDNYLIPLLGHIRLDKLTAEDIEEAWHTLLEDGAPGLTGARPLSPTTVHNAHALLSRMLRLAMQKKKIAINPAGPDSMDAPAKSDVEVEPLSTGDWRKVLDAAAAVRNTPRWSVALAMGLRQGEALALRWDDVDLDTGTLRVHRTVFRQKGKGLVFGPTKTDRSKREIALPAPLVAELKAHRKVQAAERLAAGDHWHDAGLVFAQVNGRPIDPREDRRHWHALLASAGVAPVKLHAARHTAATTMLLRGIDPRVVMDIMGWSQISTAARYQHAVSEAKRQVADKLAAAYWA